MPGRSGGSLSFADGEVLNRRDDVTQSLVHNTCAIDLADAALPVVSDKPAVKSLVGPTALPSSRPPTFA